MNDSTWPAYKQYVHQYPPKKRFRLRLKPLPADKPILNLVMLVATIYTTSRIGGIWYSFGLLTILFAHEMGHFLMCRKYRIPATLPYFLPFPDYSPFGTLGALIQIRGAFPHRRALFDIGITGPIASFVLAVLAIYVGIRSSIETPDPVFLKYELIFGKSLMFLLIEKIATIGYNVNVSVLDHPMIFAGWVGLFVTALNLLPIGQLDGGHVVYSMLGKRSLPIFYIFLAGFGVMIFFYYGWALFFILLLLFGRKHPPPIDDYSEIDKKRKLLGVFMFLVFLLSFSPIPIEIP
jgi:membrane-associated protease RseP (regulator of RpoE activity)